MSLREELLATARALVACGLNRGTSGNVSVRDRDGFLITPSGMAVDMITAEDMVAMDFSGRAQGTRPPSSEWRFHRDILRARPEVGAVIHTHAMFATTLACLRREVPACHYLIAVAGGNNIRCAPYALFGSQALSDVALEALQDRRACLLANHGMLALGRDLAAAFSLAREVETLCELYWRTLQIGEPALLDEAQMAEVMQQFLGYAGWAGK